MSNRLSNLHQLEEPHMPNRKFDFSLPRPSAGGHHENTESRTKSLQVDDSFVEGPAVAKPSLRDNLLMTLKILAIAAAIGLSLWVLDLVRVR